MRLKDLENWLTPGDVAMRSGITRQAIHKRLAESKYRAIKTRQGWLIDPESGEKEGSSHTGERTSRAGV